MSFINSGVNLSWEAGRNYTPYGYSIGISTLDGMYHGGYSHPHARHNLEKALQSLSSRGFKTLRVFLFCDFRAGVHFDSNGFPYFDEKVYEDSHTLFSLSEKYGFEIIPVLIDFYVANRWFLNPYDPVDHPEIFTDEIVRKKIEELFCRYIGEFSRTYRDVIQAWDLFNEPEWAFAISFRIFPSSNDLRVAYIKEMYSMAGKVSCGIPITTGWCLKENAVRFKDYSDIIQAHCYWQSFSSFTEYLIKKSGGKKVFAGEAGAKNKKGAEKIISIAREKDIQVLFWDSPIYYCPERLIDRHRLP